MVDYKEVIGWLFGAAIAVVWVAFALLGAGNMVFLVVAISLSILLGVSSGGFIELSKNQIDYKELIGWLLGSVVGIVWVAYGLLGPGDMVFLVAVISLTILLGTASGGFLALSKSAKSK